MAKKRTSSSLFNKLGTQGKKAFNAHKSDETKMPGGGDLPEGIEHGVAELVDCKFDTFKKGDMKGEYFFYAAGVVKSPKFVDIGGAKVKVEGLRTSIMEPMCETPGRSRESIEDHLEWVLNELRKLGVDTEEIDYEDLESTVEALKEAGVTFGFRTWKGEATKQYPNPRVNHQWRGAIDLDEEEGDEDDIEDETDDEEEDEVEEEEGDDEEVEEVEEEGDEDEEGEDEEGEEDDEEEESDEEEAEEEDDEGEEWVPEKGEVYLFKPPRARKAVEVEVTAVFKSKRTVTVKNLDDGKVFKSVSWDKLEE